MAACKHKYIYSDNKFSKQSLRDPARDHSAMTTSDHQLAKRKLAFKDRILFNRLVR